MADSNLSQLLGRDFGNTVLLTGDDQYRIEAGVATTSIDMNAISARALLAIIEHQILGKVATPFASRHDMDVLARVRAISDDYEAAQTIADRADTLIREASEMLDNIHAAQVAASAQPALSGQGE